MAHETVVAESILAAIIFLHFKNGAGSAAVEFPNRVILGNHAYLIFETRNE